jgi:hypothetical protein
MKGFLTVAKVLLADGAELPTQKAVEYGWLPNSSQPAGWGLARHEVPLGPNLFVDGGRQLLAYCFGGRSPLSDFFCQKFGVGTGTTAPAVTDSALEAPVSLDNAAYTKQISSIDFPAPFVCRIECPLSHADGAGYLLTEIGLFSGNDSLFARSTNLGINKTSDFAPVIMWRIRF